MTIPDLDAFAEQLVSVTSAARMCRVSTARVYNWLNVGDLQGVVIDGKPFVARTSAEQLAARRRGDGAVAA